MNSEQKMKLAKAKQQSQAVEVSFSSKELGEIHDRFLEIQGSISKALDEGRWADITKKHQDTIVELNNSLVKVVSKMEGLATVRDTDRIELAEAKLALSKAIETIPASIPKSIKLDGDIKLPKWLETVDEIKNFSKSLNSMAKKIEGLPKDLRTGQEPGDFLPIRRVYKQGNRLVFDDSLWSSSPGGGGGSGGSVQIIDSGGDAVTVTNGKLDVNATVNASVDTTGLATDTNQTNGSQKSQIVDSGGEAVTVTGGKLDVNASVDTTGLATSAKQDTIIGHLDGVEGTLTTIDADTGNIATNTTDLPNVIGTDGAAGPSKAVSVAGTDGSGNLQEISTNTTGHVNIADGGNSITVDGTVGVSGTVTVDGSGVTQPVSNAGLTELAAAINSSKVDVNIVSSDVSSGGTAAADDADFTAGTTPGTPSMGVYESTPTTVTDGDLGTVGITSGRRLKTSSTIDAALPAGNNNIGDVDVASSALPTGASTSAKQDTIIGHLDGVESLLTDIEADTDTLAVVGGGTEATAQRVTIANDSTGVLSVDDNGASLTVDNAGLTELAAAINSNKIDVNIASSDVATGGTSAIDDADFVDGTTSGTPGMGVYESTPSTVTDGDLGVIGITEDRQLKVKQTDPVPVTDNGGSITVDNAGLTELAGAIDTEVQVDVVGALPAGNNNIGDVDIASLPNEGQQTMANSISVAVASNQSAIPVDGSGVTQPVSNAGLTELAAAINSSKVDVNIVSSDVATGGTSAADDADFTAGTTSGTPAMGVYESTPTSVTDGDLGTVGITSGRRLKTSATIDAALPAGTNNIGDVDVLSSALPTGASTSAKQDTIIGHVDGIEDLLTTIDGDTGTIAGAVSGSEMQVDVVTSALPSGAATSAKQDTQITAEQAIQTSVELIDDTVATLGTTTYTEATTKAVTIGAVRRDADTTLVNTTNEVAPLQVDANGRLKVEAFSGETLPVSLTSTTVTGTVAVTQSGTWDEIGINDSGNSITVDNGGTFATQVDGAALTALQLLDDIVYTDDTSTHATGTSKGALIMGAATPTDTAVNANDIGAIGMTNNRAMYVSVQDALPAGTNGIGKLTANSGVDIGDVDVTTIAGVAPAFNTGTRSATTQRVTIATDDLVPVSMATNTPVGNVAHDAADSGAPLKVGGKARTTNPTAVADADRVDATFDDIGRQVVTGSIRDLKVAQNTTITSSTSETTILTAGAAGVFHDVYGLIVTNTSATGTEVSIKDATAGTTRIPLYVPATETRGFMLPESAAHNQATAANNWTATCTTSVASIKITVLAVKNV